MVKNLKRFLKYYRPYKRLFFLDLFCAVAAALLELLFPLTVSHIVDTLLPTGNWDLILSSCAALVGVYLVNTALKYVVGYWGERLGLYIETDLRTELYTHMQKLSFRFFDNHKTGQLASRISNDLLDVGNMAHYGPEHFLIAVFTLIGALFLMFCANWQLALLLGVFVLILLAINIYFMQRLVAARGRMFGAIGGFISRLEDGIGGIRVVQAFANENYQKKLFMKDNQKFCEAKIEGFKNTAKNEAVTYIFINLLPLLALLGASWFTLNGGMSSGELFSFILLATVMVTPVQMLTAFSVHFPNGMAGFKNFLEIMDTEPEIKDAANAVEATSLGGDIRYENITFGYNQGQAVLKNINLSICTGETVAFVGTSGSGKTTLCSLLPRFYEPEAGYITIDGLDIRDMTLYSLRRQIGVVQQDVFLFVGTIRENIQFGKLDATEQEIWEAARRAQLDAFIREQPDGLDTIIGERGVKLSGGQKQRLSIARMFLKNPPILILDEATSSLDTQTEAAVQQSLAELSKGRTTLVIAHRLATVRNADRIVVLAESGIMEQGSHEQLLQQGGIYSRLHRAQAGA
ncbi:ABC transporter ATP-binding protein|uniref:ATP-binding cassette, subfamily B n=1 Tax=Dendrosporobacter quercicolus TaxID=146817 RepID=A0A1G9MRP3_9FIRM|nr:ABC transporter ATP-binding protein [Dendrosporobacter quercicolus]NSL47120.1 ABC transporter ATP-binding protein [Dendrosporobacter quercicolus DSM 1736]SDL76976.1 ATP-binding cassette, subfamily B [Dendrosporobacter quercicolus]